MGKIAGRKENRLRNGRYELYLADRLGYNPQRSLRALQKSPKIYRSGSLGVNTVCKTTFFSEIVDACRTGNKTFPKPPGYPDGRNRLIVLKFAGRGRFPFKPVDDHTPARMG